MSHTEAEPTAAPSDRLSDGPSAQSSRIRLDIAYDGSGFSGWTRQPGLRTVQGELESALAVVFRRAGAVSSLVVAGRTDAGVHATGQVAHLDLTREQLDVLAKPHRGGSPAPVLEAPALLARRLNGLIGQNGAIHVSRSVIAPAGFDARFSALWRRYEYRIADPAAVRNPLERHRTLWHPAVLDVSRMNAAAASLLGLHDWASYCKRRDGATTIRTLQEFRWERLDDGVMLACVQADAFCHSMVRSLVGACVAVGAGKLKPGRLIAIRDSRVRSSEFKVVPALGLTLVEVGYPPDADLAARAESTRARRETGHRTV